MAADPPARRQGFWLTAGEIVGVLALVIAGLNLWDSHQQRIDTARQAVSESQAASAFVARGQVERGGGAIVIAPVKSAEVITEQRYVFPAAVLAAPRDINAAQPRIEADWLEPGLRQALATAHVRGAGQGRLPVILETTYVEDGETHADASLYEVGYDWKPRLFGGERIRLDGLALARRGAGGFERKLLDGAWANQSPKGAG